MKNLLLPLFFLTTFFSASAQVIKVFELDIFPSNYAHASTLPENEIFTMDVLPDNSLKIQSYRRTLDGWEQVLLNEALKNEDNQLSFLRGAMFYQYRFNEQSAQYFTNQGLKGKWEEDKITRLHTKWVQHNGTAYSVALMEFEDQMKQSMTNVFFLSEDESIVGPSLPGNQMTYEANQQNLTSGAVFNQFFNDEWKLWFVGNNFEAVNISNCELCGHIVHSTTRNEVFYTKGSTELYRSDGTLDGTKLVPFSPGDSTIIGADDSWMIYINMSGDLKAYDILTGKDRLLVSKDDRDNYPKRLFQNITDFGNHQYYTMNNLLVWEGQRDEIVRWYLDDNSDGELILKENPSTGGILVKKTDEALIGVFFDDKQVAVYDFSLRNPLWIGPFEMSESAYTFGLHGQTPSTLYLVSNSGTIYELDKTVESHEVLGSKTRVYPNPSNGLLNIDGLNIRHISITSIEGKEVFEGDNTQSEMMQIDLTRESPGIYIIKGMESGMPFLRKLILK